MKRTTAIIIAGLTISGTARGGEIMHSGELEIALERLANTGRVLYVAAHPDDENTRLLGYLAKHRHLDVAYLSMTRGGGGQNLIGSEQAALLGVIRTQELLAARRIDSAKQRFTRAVDFGYSKTADETFSTWNHDEILADVVWVIRTFQPDVIITRFNEEPPNHGHHTASAILAREAFEAAKDPKRFREQLTRGAQPWSAERLLLNVPRWGRDGEDVSGFLALDVGGYDPRLGLSYGELAANSRSMHKSQGFGSAGARGPILEYFEVVAGSAPKKAKSVDLVSGIDTTWKRIRGADAVRVALDSARKRFRPDRPEAAVPSLLTAYRTLDQLAKSNDPRVLDARTATAEAIAACSGLFVRADAERAEATPGSTVKVALEIIKRRPVALALSGLAWDGEFEPRAEALSIHEPKSIEVALAIPKDAAPSARYWLAKPADGGRYRVTDPALVGEPEGPDARSVRLRLRLDKTTFELTRPVVHTSTDPVLGERSRRFEIVPPVTVTPLAAHAMLPNGAAQDVRVAVRAAEDVTTRVELPAPKSWTVEPSSKRLTLKKGEERVVVFSVKAPAKASPEVVHPAAEVAGRSWSYRYDLVDHPHIPVQAILQPSSLKLVPIALKSPTLRIGYLPGSGDTVADDLRSVGLSVEEIDAESLKRGALDRYDTIVVGVRAFNVRNDLGAGHAALMKWIEAGGTLVVQYNTSNRWRKLTDPMGPHPFEIDRDRVTDETATIELIDPEHRAFTHPNPITPTDFEDWVQERGLYFAKTWDKRYRPLLRMHDADEAPLEGALLVAPYGKGTFVYTGVSFFRQLPAGVPGAYRLLVNLLSLGHS